MKISTALFLCIILLVGCRRDTTISNNTKGFQKKTKLIFFNKTKHLKDYSTLQSLFNIIIGKNKMGGNIYISYDVDAVNRNNFQSFPSYSEPPFDGGAVGFIDDTIQNQKYSFSIGNLFFDQFTYNQITHNYKISSLDTSLDLLRLYNRSPSFHLDSNGITIGSGSVAVPDTLVMDTIPGTRNCKFIRNSLPASWNIDNNNKLGVVVAITAYDASKSITKIIYDVVPDSDGKYDFSAMVNSCPDQNKFMLMIYRGNYTTIMSSSGKSYTVVVFSKCRQSIFF